MAKMKLADSIMKGREKLIEVLRDSKEQWEIGERTSQYGTPVRLFYETRNDGANPAATVLMTDDYRPEEITPEIVADLLYDRVVEKNEAVIMGINFMSESVRSGKSTINPDMIEGVLAYTKPLDTYKKKVLGDYKASSYMIESELAEKGFDRDKMFEMKKEMLMLAQKALLLNTDEDGNCPLLTSKHVADHILTQSFAAKMENESPVYKEMLTKLKSAKPSEETQKQSAKPRRKM